MGFLLGLVLMAGVGYSQLVQEYQAASGRMLASVDELKASTIQLSTLLKRLTELERDLRDLEGRAVSKDELDRLATETKRLTDSAYIDQLDLKTSLLDLEGDVAQLIKHANTHIRI